MYWVIAWKLLFNGGMNFLMGGDKSFLIEYNKASSLPRTFEGLLIEKLLF